MMERKHLISTIEQIKDYVRINVSVLKDTFLPYEPEARNRYLAKYIGKDLHNEILTYAQDKTFPEYANTDATKKVFEELVQKCTAVTAKFTLFIASPHLDLHLSEQGFIVAMTQNSAPASTARVEASTNALKEQGFAAIEDLLQFLEENHATFPSYKNHHNNVISKTNFIKATSDFEIYVKINGSRYRFLEEIQPEMTNFEIMVIQPMISKGLTNKLLLGNFGENENYPELLDLVKRAIANSVEGTLTDEDKERRKKNRLTLYGNHYVAQIKKHLDKVGETYPEYKNSDSYTPKHTLEHYDNSDTTLFVFGG